MTTTTRAFSVTNQIRRALSHATVAPLFVSPVMSRDYSTVERKEGDHNQQRRTVPLVICGPSGVGKGSIIAEYMTKYPQRSQHFGFTVSHTTRNPRPGEIDGQHYHFTTVTEFINDIDNAKFLEHAQVHGNYYGTSLQSLKDVEANNKICLLDIDVQGVQTIKAHSSDIPANFIFIAPPSVGALRSRLAGRGTESEESLQRRTANAVAELKYGREPGNFDYILINDDLNRACEELDQIIQELYFS